MTGLLALLMVLTPVEAHREWKRDLCHGERVEGKYANILHPFSVVLPVPGLCCAAAGPDVGVSIPLDDSCSAVIVVSGSYGAEPGETVADLLRRELRERVAAGERVSPVRSAKIGSLRAVSAVVHYRAPADEIEEVVVALGDHRHVFTARLATTSRRYTSDRRVFDRVLASFRALPEGSEGSPEKAPENNGMHQPNGHIDGPVPVRR